MPQFAELVDNYHAVTFGGAVLLGAGDYFLPGQEPRMSKASVVDTPACAGRANGEVYGRGNSRWRVQIQRVKYFDGDYPLTDGAGTYASPQEHAQKWLAAHLTTLNEGVATCTVDGKALANSVCEPEGTTDGPFAIVTYNILGAEAG